LLNKNIQGLQDSKKITQRNREILFNKIEKNSDFIGIGVIGARLIDEGNILAATLKAMELAHQGSFEFSDIPVIVDGNALPNIDNATCLVKADSKIPAVMAASIVAKVYRDSIMSSLSSRYKDFNFDKNMGYGTSFHLKSISKFKISDYHRTSFKPVAMQNMLNE